MGCCQKKKREYVFVARYLDEEKSIKLLKLFLSFFFLFCFCLCVCV